MSFELLKGLIHALAFSLAANAFKVGQYGLVNLLHYPAKNVMVGGELQWGNRENFSDGFSVDDYRIQFSFRYNFSHTLGGADR